MLACDVDLGTEYLPICGRVWKHVIEHDDPADSFKGSLDGRGYKISYKTAMTSELVKQNDYAYGLFGTIKNATVSNLNIVASVTSKGEQGERVDGMETSAGGLAGMSLNSTIRNVNVLEESVIRNWKKDQLILDLMM